MGGKALRKVLVVSLLIGVTSLVRAQSFRVQCPTSTITHPTSANNNSEPAYNGPTTFTCSVTGGCTAANNVGYLVPNSTTVNGAIKCQQISGGDGYSTMADGTQTFMFSFGPLSGLADIAAGKPGTQFPNVFNTVYTAGTGTLLPGDPATTDGASDAGSYSAGGSTFNWNGAVGLTPDLDAIGDGTCATPCLDGHVDPRQIMDVGVMNGNIPAPLIAFDEDDEFFLTLTNVGMIMRPDLFEQHTVHFHGYPNASSFYDGVPDASVAINIGGSFTYYYLAPDAGTYFWHCHITPPEHLQMGMVGQLYVRARQDRVPLGQSLYTYLQYQNGVASALGTAAPDLRTACNAVTPATSNTIAQGLDKLGNTQKYTYNDGDGSTAYDVE